MTALSQTTLSNAFSWMKILEFRLKKSLKFVPKGLINNTPALVLIMAWRRPGDKPLSEPMLVRSLTHICVTRPQWVNNAFHITGPLWGKPPVTGRFPSHRASNAKLLFHLCWLREQAVEQTVELPVILIVMTLMWYHCYDRASSEAAITSLNTSTINHITTVHQSINQSINPASTNWNGEVGQQLKA